MNPLILLAMFLVLFKLLNLPVYYDEIIVNALSFLSGLNFGYFLAGLKRNQNLKQLSDDLNSFIQTYNKNVSN